MKLLDWLDDNRLTVTKFAEEAGCSRVMMSYYCHGVKPSSHMIKLISLLTSEDVTAKDFEGSLPYRKKAQERKNARAKTDSIK